MPHVEYLVEPMILIIKPLILPGVHNDVMLRHIRTRFSYVKLTKETDTKSLEFIY